MLSNYQIQKIIGKGTFSTVKLAIDKETGEKKAIKILEKNKIKNNRDLNRIKREIDMVKKINHLNIVKVFDIKEDDKKYYIIMEYCENGELFNLILEKHKLGEDENTIIKEEKNENKKENKKESKKDKKEGKKIKRFI